MEFLITLSAEVVLRITSVKGGLVSLCLQYLVLFPHHQSLSCPMHVLQPPPILPLTHTHTASSSHSLYHTSEHPPDLYGCSLPANIPGHYHLP